MFAVSNFHLRKQWLLDVILLIRCHSGDTRVSRMETDANAHRTSPSEASSYKRCSFVSVV